RVAVTALPTRLVRSEHAAVALADGTVLLSGGFDTSGTPTTAAAVYLRSPLSPWSSLPPLTLESASDPYLARRPDRALASAGQLLVSAPAPVSDGRPAELALIAGMHVMDFSLDLLGGRRAAGSAAIIFGWQSEASYDFIVIAPGRAVELWTV